MTKVHIYIRTTDGLGTDTKGLTIHELSPKESDEHYDVFNASKHGSGKSKGHGFIRAAFIGGAEDGYNVHVAKHNGEIVGAISHDLEDVDKQRHRYITNIGSIHPGAGHALLRHVADISEKEGSHLQGSPINDRVRDLYSTLARRAGGDIERVGEGRRYRLKRPGHD